MIIPEAFQSAAQCHKYDQSTGAVFRVVRYGKPCEPLPIKARDRDGYLILTSMVGKKQFRIYVHRFVWFLHNGVPPKGLEVDHINGDKNDNRIENLRLATRMQNRHNSKVKGYWWHPSGGYEAEITTNKVRQRLGWFKTEEDAKAAYFEAAKKQREEFLTYVAPK